MAREQHDKVVSFWSLPSKSILDNILAGKAQSVFWPDTNVHPSAGVLPKIRRNNALVHSVYRQTQGYMLIGDRTNETMSDPLHRNPRYILQRFREENSGLGRDRSMIRPAAPQQVTWKNQYWRVQRPPYRSPIGPYTQGQLKDQSIMSRITYWLGGGNTTQ